MALQESGKRMALSNLALFGGAFFTPVLVGKITHTIGWQWTFYFIAIFSGVLLPFVFLFVPETAYCRTQKRVTEPVDKNYFDHAPRVMTGQELAAEEPSRFQNSPTASGNGSIEKHPGDMGDRHLSIHGQVQGSTRQKVGFGETLMPFNGRKTDENFFKLLLRPLPLFLHPAIIWGCLIQGTLIGWTVMIGVVLAAIFLGPPLFFDEVKTGYMYTGAFIGAMLGFIMAGVLSDWSTKLMVRRNKGVYEPEFRIVLVIAQLVFSCAGLYGFGITGNNVAKYGWFLPDFFFALVVIGMVLGAVASALYIVDAHRKISSFSHPTLNR